ncbi:MAG: TetR/AcrR family transcriptional regulator [Acidimicrobiales bacterium]
MVEGRSGSTRQTLIDATAARLRVTDESELRIADVCEDTGLSSSVIYSNFRSRQGLIDATFLTMYDDLARRYVELLQHNTADAVSLDSLLAFYRVGEGQAPVQETLREFRRIRLRVSTAALARPELQRAVVQVQEDHVSRMSGLIEDLQARGLLGRGLRARQLAVLLEGFSFGRALDDISLHPESDASWYQMLVLVLENM